MKFTLSWLKDYLHTDASLDKISETLTAIGLEVEEIIDPAAGLEAFTVAEIVETEQHPNADRLRVCKVNTGTQTLQIVCGAPNARAGIKVALAQEGTIIPNGSFKIKKSKIRDVESNGMMCSARELNLGDDHDGIIELPDAAILGEPIATALQLNDPVIDIALTPNRGDCLGIYGIARDLAAAGLGKLKALSEIENAKLSLGTASHPINVTLEDKGCTEFVYATLHDVTNTAAPAWIQQRLKAIGLRPISALVDVTNYISIAFGRPLHVYDLDKLQGNITVRTGKAGESFDALNDKTITLKGGEIAITDDSGVIGLGGIIGGVSTGCDENTRNVLLEVAWFDPIRIAQAGRELQVESDARYRFERSVDPAFLHTGAKLALDLIYQLCGGKMSEIKQTGKSIHWQRSISYTPLTLKKRLGMEVSEEEQLQILKSLGFELQKDAVSPPSWRPDIEGEADLTEEIARIHGYAHIPVTPLEKPACKTAARQPIAQRAYLAKQALAEAGFIESCHWSFLSSEIAPSFGGTNDALKLLNPISSELDQMRPSLLPHLSQAIQKNTDRGLHTNRLFEVGLQFHDATPKGQSLMASGVLSPLNNTKHFHQPLRCSDIYDAKAAIEHLVAALGFNASRLQLKADAPAWYHPGKSGSYCLGKQVIAQFGEIHPHVAKLLDISEGMIGFEIFLEAIPFPKKKVSTRPALQLSEFQPVQRDFAFVVDQSQGAADLTRIAEKADPKLVQAVDLFDVYQGKGLEENEKSLALRVTLQATDHTLTEKEISAYGQKVIKEAEKLGAKLRA